MAFRAWVLIRCDVHHWYFKVNVNEAQRSLIIKFMLSRSAGCYRLRKDFFSCSSLSTNLAMLDSF